ncbi:PRS27 protease, partial [Tichodroma muraria]|nr:PRS27 protease [Tichodroma muraria]
AEALPWPRRLRQLQVPLLGLGRCRRLYGTDLGPALPPRRIRGDMLCAGQGGRDTCKVRDTWGQLGHTWGGWGHAVRRA